MNRLEHDRIGYRQSWGVKQTTGGLFGRDFAAATGSRSEGPGRLAPSHLFPIFVP